MINLKYVRYLWRVNFNKKNDMDNPFKKILGVTLCIFGGLAVIMGAFGAHALKDSLSATAISSYETAVLYQMIHVLAGLYAISRTHPYSKWIPWAAGGFILGIILFSGSLYLLSTRELTGWGVQWMGPVTPIGGLSFILGWICLAIAHLKGNIGEKPGLE